MDGSEQQEGVRRHPRVPVDAKVDLVYDSFASFISDYVSNVSRGGMFITTTQVREAGSRLTFELRLRDDYPLIRGRGEVVWVKREGEGDAERATGMAVKFLQLDEQSAELIDRMVNQHMEEGGAPFQLSQAESAAAATSGGATSDGPFETGASDDAEEDVFAAAPASAGARPASGDVFAASPPSSEPDRTEVFALPGEPEPPTFGEELLPPMEEALPASDDELLPAMEEALPAVAEEPRPPTEEALPPADDGLLPAMRDFLPATEGESAAVVEETPLAPLRSFSAGEDSHLAPPPVEGSPFEAPPTKPMRVEVPPVEPVTVQTAARRRPDRGRRRWSLLAALAVVIAGVAAVAVLWRQGSLELPVLGRAGSRPAAVEPTPADVASTRAPAVTPQESTSGPAAEAGAATAAPQAANPAPTAVPPPPTPTAVPPARPADAVTDIRWSEGAGGTEVTITGNGRLERSRLREYRLDDPPREVIRIVGITSPYSDRPLDVGDPVVSRIRVGFHPEMSPAELHVVIDLVDPGVQLKSLDVAGGVVSARFGHE